MLLNTIPRPAKVRLAYLALAGLIASAIFAPALAPAFTPVASAVGPNPADATLVSRISASDPLNGGFLIANMHGMLFHPDTNDISEDLAYARWLGAGVVRVFGTDSNGAHAWNGAQVGARIVSIAPMLRAAHLRLIVAFVNNHQAVPGEMSGSAGWMDNYMQLLLPFYTTSWHGAYHQFVHDLISMVESNNAQDVIFAWELGNELHTPVQPDALMPFITQDAAEVRALDPVTPILPGTMGANHVEPGHPNSAIARWLYCEAPVDAYTLHAYDWVSRQRPGDMPIDWDLDNILSQPCPNGRALPVIVEELGTSRVLAGMYTADDERGRLQQEQRQIEFVRHFPQVVGFGVWNAESPRLVDRTFVDTRRGLTSYGSRSMGGGSCYDPTPDPAPGARCQLEQLLRGSRFVRASNQWTPGPLAQATDSMMGAVDPVFSGDANATALTLTGWVADPTATDGTTGVDGLDVYLSTDLSAPLPLAGARMGQKRDDVSSSMSNPVWVDSGFTISLPLDSMPSGPTQLTLVAHTPDGATWLSNLAVVVPNLGAVPAPAVLAPANPVPVAVATPLPAFRAEVESPQPGDQVSRGLVVQVLAQGADRVDVFLEPDRDEGGKLVGTATRPLTSSGVMNVTLSLPTDAHTLYVHVASSVTGQQALFTLPVIVR
jgi:hypothetical protein